MLRVGTLLTYQRSNTDQAVREDFVAWRADTSHAAAHASVTGTAFGPT